LKIKVGIGFDIHPLEEGRKLILGGVEIPYEKGLKGHSDGDVIIHAIIDAILGALGEKSIGELFPDTDERYKNIESTVLLSKVAEIINEKNAKVVNIDCVVIAQQPRLVSFIPLMRDKLSKVLGVRSELLNIKAKTHEGIGELGRGEAISCYSIVVLKEKW
jgi:2-C-methyl-D-erythritol 2,4-cyclodiphosphate synthase